MQVAVTPGDLTEIVTQFRTRFEQVALWFNVALFLRYPGQGIKRQAQTQG